MGIFKDCGCGCGGAKAQQKFLISAMSSLVFFIIANPDTFRLTRSIFGRWVSGPTGCPTLRGLALHTVVFLLITWAMMNIKKEGYSIEEEMPMMVGPSPEEEEPVITPPMAEIPEPLPGFSEMQYDAVDSGLELAPLDVMGDEIDKPVSLKVHVQKQATCQCDDGKTVTIK
jgi:hypothetical protein